MFVDVGSFVAWASFIAPPAHMEETPLNLWHPECL